MRILLDELLDDSTQYGNRQKEMENYIMNKFHSGYSETDIVDSLIDEYYLEDFETEYDYIADFVHNTITTYKE